MNVTQDVCLAQVIDNTMVCVNRTVIVMDAVIRMQMTTTGVYAFIFNPQGEFPDDSEDDSSDIGDDDIPIVDPDATPDVDPSDPVVDDGGSIIPDTDPTPTPDADPTDPPDTVDP